MRAAILSRRCCGDARVCALLRKLCEQGHPIGHTEFAALTQLPAAQPNLPHLVMPGHHEVRPSDVFTRRLHGTLAAAAERGPVDFQELLLTPGVGAHRAISGDGGRSGAWRAVPFPGPRAVFARAWRQGPPSLSGADQGL